MKKQQKIEPGFLNVLLGVGAVGLEVAQSGEGVVPGVGNAAGAGAMLALISLPWRRKACAIAQQAEHIELSQRPDFQQMFMETMLFM